MNVILKTLLTYTLLKIKFKRLEVGQGNKVEINHVSFIKPNLTIKFITKNNMKINQLDS